MSHERWLFAQACQRRYQDQKSRELLGDLELVRQRARASSLQVLGLLAECGFELPSPGIVVEVGSGAHGLIWRWPAGYRIAVDPLAPFYRDRFAFLQRDGPAVVAARGEELPIESASADLVLSDNVLDHVEDPVRLLAELRRILRAGGCLFLSADVHHPIYGWAGRCYNLAFQAGLRWRLPAFPSHPYHFARNQLLRLLEGAGFELVSVSGGDPAVARRVPLSRSRPFDVVKRLLFKNARVAVVAR